MSPKALLSAVLVAAITLSSAISVDRSMGRARQASAEIRHLEPELKRTFNEMVAAIRKRAIEQQNWLKQGYFGNTDSSPLEGQLDQLLSLRFETASEFDQGDRLQTAISDTLARQLASGSVSRELAKKVEKADMDVMRKRAEYFGVVSRQHQLLGTPLLSQVEKKPVHAALVFPSEKVFLSAGASVRH